MPFATLQGGRWYYHILTAYVMKFSTLRTHIDSLRSRQSRAVYAVMGLAAAAGLVWALWEHHFLAL